MALKNDLYIRSGFAQIRPDHRINLRFSDQSGPVRSPERMETQHFSGVLEPFARLCKRWRFERAPELGCQPSQSERAWTPAQMLSRLLSH